MMAQKQDPAVIFYFSLKILKRLIWFMPAGKACGIHIPKRPIPMRMKISEFCPQIDFYLLHSRK